LDFYFYFVSFFTVVGGWVAICGWLYPLSSSRQLQWFFSTWVGFLFDFIVVETLFAALSPNVNGCCKLRGIYFDFDIYEKFYLKKLV
jgi:hypothetical protein